MNENTNSNVYADSRYKIFNDLNLGDVRTYVDEEGGLWFYMNDIARILDIANPRNVVAGLRNSGFGGSVHTVDTPTNTYNQHTEFTYNVKETIVRETTLGWICGRSKKPNAMRLCQFISEKVIPSLARRGGYIMPEDRDKYKEDPIQIKELIQYNEQLEKYVDKLNARYKRLEGEKDYLEKENERITTNAYNFDQPAAKIDELMHEILNNDIKSYEIIDRLERIRVDMQLATNSLQRPETL